MENEHTPLTEKQVNDFKERMSKPFYVAPLSLPRHLLEALKKEEEKK